MIIVTLVATLAASMVWQQWRAVQVEVAERARNQSAWILSGALDWARLILREDQRSGRPTALTEPWAVPLAEARLSTFLAAAADKDTDTTDSGPEAFLSGEITDAQARYNLINLVDGEGKPVPAEQQALERLCQAVGVSNDVAARIASGLHDAMATTGATSASPLMPGSVAQLSWLGVDGASIRLLQPFVVLLRDRTLLNVNTASREVLAAVTGLDAAAAEALQMRQRTPFTTVDKLVELIPAFQTVKDKLATQSDYFDVRGRLRLSDRVLEQRSLVQRQANNAPVKVLQREWVSSRESGR